MILSIWLFENQFVNIVSISFTALVLNELLMVALEINTWHRLMIVSEIATLVIYVGSMVFLPTYFGKFFLLALFHIVQCFDIFHIANRALFY